MRVFVIHLYAWFYHRNVCIFLYICMRDFVIHLYACLYACFSHMLSCTQFWKRDFVIQMYEKKRKHGGTVPFPRAPQLWQGGELPRLQLSAHQSFWVVIGDWTANPLVVGQSHSTLSHGCPEYKYTNVWKKPGIPMYEKKRIQTRIQMYEKKRIKMYEKNA